MAELIAIDGFEEVPLTAAWVCLLTTDEHVIAAFDDELRKYRREAREQAAQVPVLVHLLSAGAEAMFLAAAELAYPKCRSIDLQLMHLQRRETLWRTILGGTIVEDSLRLGRIATLQEEIDDAWKDKWVRRPFD